jgi:methyltransferase-like protein/SAM-dependent methyltransferase
MMSVARDDYDLVPYWGKTYPQTHPDRLCALGTLLGMQPAPVEKCRGLELGCGDGINLIGFATVLTGSEFVGIDLSKVHIAAGLEMARNLDLRNVELYARDIMEDLSALGQFDYIIAHGLYSWVPPAVQDRVMELCRCLLTQQGIAFVSYNTYPGAHLRMMLREMMLFHTQGYEEPSQRIKQAGALLGFLQTASAEDDPYLLLMKKETERIQSFPAAHLFHDDLAEFYNPVYFHQFIDHATKHGLQFLTEAEYHETQDLSFPEEAARILKTMEYIPVIREQYIDFLRCRRFRQTLLCREEVAVRNNPESENIRSLRIAAQIRPMDEKTEELRDRHYKFEHARGSSFTIDLPLFNEALKLLGSIWPRSMPFTELAEGAIARLKEGSDLVEEKGENEFLLAGLFLRLHAANLIELHSFEPPYARTPGLKPLASPLARLKIRDTSLIPNLRHFNVCIDDPMTKRLLPMLDGTRDRKILTSELMSMVESGDIRLGESYNPDEALEANVHKILEFCLSDLARCGLLMDDAVIR